jgi:hypothetical protein
MSNERIPIVKVHRFWQNENQTLGACTVLDPENQPIFAGLALERGWRNNERMVSCYPQGVYELVYEYSDRFGRYLWEVKDVPNRSECKFHSANHWHELNGCTSLGSRPKDFDNDGYLDITNSRNTMKDFHYALRHYKRALLIVTGEPSTC